MTKEITAYELYCDTCGKPFTDEDSEGACYAKKPEWLRDDDEGHA